MNTVNQSNYAAMTTAVATYNELAQQCKSLIFPLKMVRKTKVGRNMICEVGIPNVEIPLEDILMSISFIQKCIAKDIKQAEHNERIRLLEEKFLTVVSKEELSWYQNQLSPGDAW